MRRPAGSRGSVLLITLVAVMVISIALASVLGLSLQEHRVLARAVDWNSTLPIAEAGIEEAMSHLRQVDGGNPAVNGWQLSNGNYVRSRTLNGGRFDVVFSLSLPVTIYSTGYVWSATSATEIVRRVKVTTEGQGLFTKSLVANDKIVMSGQFNTDSFDSTKPAYNTDGKYDPAKKRSNGDVATNRSGPDAVNLSGQVKIYGDVATGPTGEILQGGEVAVGTAAYIDSGGTGIQTGHHTTDMNVSFTPVTSPYDFGSFPLPNFTVDGVLYKHVLFSGEYRLSTLTLSGSDKVLVQGDATLVIDQDVSISGQAFIQINTNASLKLYVKKGAISISGQAVANQAGNAADFSIWGLPDVTDITISGNGELMGTIYAPQAKLSMSGGGNGIMNFIGAAIVNEINASGNYSFHYDEALGYGLKNLVINSWKEI